MNLGPDTSILILIADLVVNGNVSSRSNIYNFLGSLYKKDMISAEDFDKAGALLNTLNDMQQEYQIEEQNS